MSAVIYAKKDSDGHIVAISRHPVDQVDAGWCVLPGDAPEVRGFIEELSESDHALRDSDLSFVRVLEDVIDLLIERSVIRFTDLPLPAQTKLLTRRSNRKQRQGLKLFSEEGLDDGLI